MKYITLLLLLCSTNMAAQSFLNPAQIQNRNYYSFAPTLQPPADSTTRKWRSDTPGLQFQLACRSFYFGIFSSSVGTIISIMNPDDRNLKIASVGLNVVGGVLMLKAFHHINKAGILLDERKIGLTLNSGGIGIKYSLR